MFNLIQIKYMRTKMRTHHFSALKLANTQYQKTELVEMEINATFLEAISNIYQDLKNVYSL